MSDPPVTSETRTVHFKVDPALRAYLEWLDTEGREFDHQVYDLFAVGYRSAATDRDSQAERADLAERRERELREELIRMAQGFENLAELRLLDNPYYDEALRLADSARALAATDSAEPRAGQPLQTEGV
jgi:hypothetical protein